MSSGINKVILVGNLGQDPDVRYMPNGNAVVNLSVATSKSWKDRSSGEAREKTEWHRVVLFRQLAEAAAESLKKGSKVYIEGELQTRKWQDKSGHDRYTTEVVAQDMQPLDSTYDEPMPDFPEEANTADKPASPNNDDYDDDGLPPFDF